VTRIADAVHGTVHLDDSETAVVGTRAYQRLRGVKHLGLASLAFPGADYSRFAHGIGTLHVTSRILNSLETAHPVDVDEDDKRLYRMAALLHDIGHYPFSHTFERALNDFYSERALLQPKASGSSQGAGPDRGDTVPPGRPVGERWLHEDLGCHVILEDEALRAAIDSCGVDADALTRIIKGNNPPKYANLVSSDLDADRVDYLMRTAKHTGLPYGNVDLDYLLSQICLDAEKHICFSAKGLRAAEHVLLCRYYDYQQVSFHKTVAGLELVLNDAIGALLRNGALSVTPDDLQAMIGDDRWHSFDDAYIIAEMRGARSDSNCGSRDTLLYSSILDRNPPKLVADRERLGPSGAIETLRALRHTAEQRKPEWESRFDVPFYIWGSKTGTQITKIGASLPSSILEAGEDVEEEQYAKFQQSVRIMVDDTTSRPIQECGNSLLAVLSAQALYSIRVYALLPHDRKGDADAIRTAVNNDLGPAWSRLVD
jgi:uncharacterized protein